MNPDLPTSIVETQSRLQIVFFSYDEFDCIKWDGIVSQTPIHAH